MDEEVIVNPGAKKIAKGLSLISVLIVSLSGLHSIFEWSIFEPERVVFAFGSGLVLMLIAMAYNGKALGH